MAVVDSEEATIGRLTCRIRTRPDSDRVRTGFGIRAQPQYAVRSWRGPRTPNCPIEVAIDTGQKGDSLLPPNTLFSSTARAHSSSMSARFLKPQRSPRRSPGSLAGARLVLKFNVAFFFLGHWRDDVLASARQRTWKLLRLLRSDTVTGS